MKTSYFHSIAFAALTLIACSKDNVSNNEENPKEKEKKCMIESISMNIETADSITKEKFLVTLANGKITQLESENSLRKYVYNGNNLVAIYTPDGRDTMIYDGANRLIKMTFYDNTGTEQITTFEYNSNNQISKKTTDLSILITEVEYSYSSDGRLFQEINKTKFADRELTTGIFKYKYSNIKNTLKEIHPFPSYLISNTFELNYLSDVLVSEIEVSGLQGSISSMIIKYNYQFNPDSTISNIEIDSDLYTQNFPFTYKCN